MCSNRVERIVAPKKPAAGMGWWIGHVIFAENNWHRIYIMWVELPGNNDKQWLDVREESLEKFTGIEEAIAYVRQKGANVAVFA